MRIFAELADLGVFGTEAIAHVLVHCKPIFQKCTEKTGHTLNPLSRLSWATDIRSACGKVRVNPLNFQAFSQVVGY